MRTRMINRRYRLERRIVLTETTETWLGFDNVLHRAVAVTVPRQELLRNRTFIDEFLNRSRIATSLHHRGIVAAFDSGQDNDTPYLITEYAGGDTLTDIIRMESPFDVDDVAILVEHVANALEYAHLRGFVHGELRADDILVDGQGRTKVLGLGLPSGTLASPNGHGSSHLTFDDDVQALSAIAFEMLTGETPNDFDADSHGDAYQIAPDVPRNASDIVAIGMGAGPARFTSAGAFARSLSGWRAFDPAEYLTFDETPPQPVDDLDAVYSAAVPMSAVPKGSAWTGEASPVIPANAASTPPQQRRIQLALVAACALALLAVAIIWNQSESTGSLSPIPDQLRSLAQLSGF
ncbi:MAG: serine/threonine protein kinase [Thermomicrobiales bacterium]|nr:serine/threonine protein kinase [Thermomicrobiales bacterium]